MQYMIDLIVHEVQLVHSPGWKHYPTGMVYWLCLELSKRRRSYGQ
jgi:hypothetical protein